MGRCRKGRCLRRPPGRLGRRQSIVQSSWTRNYARRRVCVEKNVRLSNRRQVRAAKKEVFGTATHRQVMSVSTIDAREQMSARACSSAPLSTRESFPDGGRARVCVSVGRPAAARAPGHRARLAVSRSRRRGRRGPEDRRRRVLRSALEPPRPSRVPRRTSGRPPKRFRRRGACRRASR